MYVACLRVGQYKLLVGPQEDTTEEGPWLFDLDNDPSETTNLAGDRPDLVVELEALLMAELDSLVPLDEPESDPAGDPSNFGGVWTPGWCVAH
ncbi:hypothetical protein Pmani_013475 [Petrolisthes manimaculis]|uniref:Uncharacterized protein n=1 Tax=Petrolisthes manimaculis TaxID=1843537 RepID=A0AAE1UE13_9EUCA|nr:hypothetical protein Pmani_013475 [Petrolisthes manimaculis]